MLRKPAVILTTLALAGLMLIAGIACSSSSSKAPAAPALAQPEATGRDLSDKFMTLLKNKDKPGLQTFLSDAFIIQRADGSNSVKADYLNNLPLISLYEINGVQAKQDGSVLTVKWNLVVDEMIDGKIYGAAPAPRLSTYVWDNSAWRMTSHANFNAPTS